MPVGWIYPDCGQIQKAYRRHNARSGPNSAAGATASRQAGGVIVAIAQLR